MATVAPALRIRGRAAEIAVLGESLDRVTSGRLSVVLIEGEGGIGKTSLLDAAVQDACGRGMQVAAARAEELEQTRPFGMLADAFGCVRTSPDPRRAAIAALLAPVGGGERGPITVTSDPGLRFRAVDAFADLAEELALAGPLLIGADDLQWADPSSLLTLGALSRRLAYLPVCLIGCLRPSPRVSDLDRLAAALEAAGAQRLALRGLADAAVTELVADAVAAVPGQLLLAGIAGAAGNPLFVTELLGALAQEGAIQTAGGRAEAAVVTLPRTLRLTILRRLSFLPEDTLRALRAASILGASFTLTELSATMARPAVELSVVLAEGIRGQVLADDGDRLRFRHDLIRAAIYEDLPLSVRRGLHREAAARLAESAAPALQVAAQFARGAGPGDATAIGWLIRAAREAAATSPDAAADLLGQALELMDPADPGRDLLLAELASSLMSAGRVAPAEDVCRTLLDREHDPRADGPVRICLGHVLLAAGRPRDGLSELARANESPLLTSAMRASGLGWASIARMWLADLDGSVATGQLARSAAAAAGDHMTAGIAEAMSAIVALLRGQLATALEIIDDAVQAADRSPGRQGHRYPLHVARGFVLIELDRLGRAHHRDAGCRGALQSPDRRPAVRVAADRADASRARVRQAGHHRPCAARRRGHPAPGPAGLGAALAGTTRAASDRGGADHAIPGHQGSQRVLVQSAGAGWARGHDKIAGFRAGVPDYDLGASGQFQAELGQHRTRLADRPGPVREALVPARGRPEQRRRVARAERADDHVVPLRGVLDRLQPVPAADGDGRAEPELGRGGIAVRQQPLTVAGIGPGPGHHPGAVGRGPGPVPVGQDLVELGVRGQPGRDHPDFQAAGPRCHRQLAVIAAHSASSR